MFSSKLYIYIYIVKKERRYDDYGIYIYIYMIVPPACSKNVSFPSATFDVPLLPPIYIY